MFFNLSPKMLPGFGGKHGGVDSSDSTIHLRGVPRATGRDVCHAALSRRETLFLYGPLP